MDDAVLGCMAQSVPEPQVNPLNRAPKSASEKPARLPGLAHRIGGSSCQQAARPRRWISNDERRWVKLVAWQLAEAGKSNRGAMETADHLRNPETGLWACTEIFSTDIP